jgi:hypothetical protein
MDELDAPTDEDALESARNFDHDHAIEVWELKRKVGFIRPQRRAGRPKALKRNGGFSSADAD